MNVRYLSKKYRFLLMLVCSLFFTPAAYAKTLCNGQSLTTDSTLNLRIDNDLFGGARQDQGYTNGFLLSWVSPNLSSYLDDECIPDAARAINKYLVRLQPATPEEFNMTMGIGQVMYTPANKTNTGLTRDDRPYAGALLASIGYHARHGNYLNTTQLRFGVVGPAALGGAVQSEWHRVIGVGRFRGWQNQLRNEPVLQLIHEKNYRWPGRNKNLGWGWDAIAHGGVSVGNFATYANAGLEWRFGYRLPDDFGTAPLWPAGENSAPLKTAPGRDQGLSGHIFAAVDGRFVLRDITLDGNTFRSSHSVSKRPLVADIGYGMAILYGDWKFAFARYHRTREFNGQRQLPVYGSFTISKRF